MTATPAKYLQVEDDHSDVEVASDLQTQDRSSYGGGKRSLVFAGVLGVVGVLAVISVRGVAWQQKDTPSDVTAVTGLGSITYHHGSISAESAHKSGESDHESDPSVCSSDHMGRLKKAMAAVKPQLTKGVMNRDKALWTKWFGEEPNHKGSTDEFVQKVLTNALSHMYQKLQEKKSEIKMMGKPPNDRWHVKVSGKWETTDHFDLSWPWHPSCCGQTDKKQFHCDGVCDNNFFFNWGATNDIPGVIHICPHAWDLDDVAMGAGLFHEAVHLAGGGDDIVAHGMEWSMFLGTDSPTQARHSAMNYMLYVVENGMGEGVFKAVTKKWYSLYENREGGFKKWSKDVEEWTKQQTLKAAKAQEEEDKKLDQKDSKDRVQIDDN